MRITSNNDIQHLIDAPISLRCPHCSIATALVPVSAPKFELIVRFALTEVGIVYRCSSCDRAVFLRFDVEDKTKNPIRVSDQFEQVTRAIEPFEMQYLKGHVADDFEEALVCYANSCWNAFAAMSRRCVQSVSTALGVDGSTKVQAQLAELKEMGSASPDEYDQLMAIMVSGHDGAHPHLAPLSEERALVLLHVMKDVLYQLFVRPAKILEASALRREAIEAKNAG